MTRLIADIGGTNARFALVEPDGAVRDERHLLVRDYPDLAAAAEAYLGANRVSEAVIAVATPVETIELHQQPVALFHLRPRHGWVFGTWP